MISDRKKVLFLLLAICIFCIFQSGNTVFAANDKSVGQIEVRRFFNCYDCNIDWDALIDLENNPIFNTCLDGATLSELKGLGIKDLNKRIEILQNGNLLRRVGETYQLAFPAVIGERRAELQRVVERTSRVLLPSAEKMIEEIRPHLKGHEVMLYHVVWSLVMDGHFAWTGLQNQLKKQLGRDVTFTDTTWAIHPSHPYRVGTNTYDDDVVKLRMAITWSPTTPLPHIITKDLQNHRDELLRAIAQDQIVTDPNARNTLANYGLIDNKGKLRIYIIDSNSPSSRVYATSGLSFASKVIALLDLKKLANILDTTPEKALVITYHELCYELLKQFADRHTIDIPEIALKPNVPSAQMYRLISVVKVSDPNALEKLLEENT
jgi:hypothetical protein